MSRHESARDFWVAYFDIKWNDPSSYLEWDAWTCGGEL